MKHFSTLLITLFAFIVFWTATPIAAAQSSTEQDVIQFTASELIMEDNPNAGTYCFTFYSPDGLWKAQLYYHSADGMFGTFTSSTADGSTDAFDLKGDGRYYNYVRNPKNDMVFSTFTDITLTVTDEVTVYRVAADCKANNGKRYIMDGTVDALVPTSTIESDLGYAYIVENPFYGTYTLNAENDDYRLAYGIVGTGLLGTFYRADILMPELTDKRTGEAIKVANATATHSAEGDTRRFAIDIVSEEHVLYRLTMFNAPIDVTVTEEINVDLGLNCALQDLREIYGCFQMGGQNADYGVAIAFKPEAFEKTTLEWGMDDIFMPYTTVLRIDDPSADLAQAFRETIADVKAYGKTEPHLFTLTADITCMSGRLYHVTMGVADDDYMPEVDEKVDIDFGRVAVVDYSKGLGTISIGAVKPEQFQMRFTLQATELEGEFLTSDIVSDLTDVMVVRGDTYTFHDAKAFKALATKRDDGRIDLDVSLLGVDGVLYHGTMYVDPLKCMEEDQQIDVSKETGALMLAVQEGADGDYAEYTLQYQFLPDDYDPELPISDGKVLSFYFAHRGRGLEGDYSYSDGTLDPDEPFLFFEGGTEVRVAPVAGTLSLTEGASSYITIDQTRYMTSLYTAKFHVLGQNGVIYNGEGENFVICIDGDGSLVDLTDGVIDSLSTTYADKGYDVRKMLRDGKVVIATPRGNYNAQGAHVAQ